MEQDQRVALEECLSEGFNALLKDMMKAAMTSPKTAAFLARFALSAAKAEARRRELERNDEHVPSFLIASVTGVCNLNCAGCYDRAHAVHAAGRELTADDWDSVFTQAEALGVVAVLLAGGEPLMRLDVLERAARHTALLFPVFTNGVLLKDEVLEFFENHRNMIPIISVEGGEILTDERRGAGVYRQAVSAMRALKERRTIFGASITVTRENLRAVTDDAFIDDLSARGCKAVLYVEYTPFERPELALDDETRAELLTRAARRRARGSPLTLCFPGDERESGGCLAAGRGFFHINARGGAEPCPFAPYSDTNVRVTPLREALKSPLFTRLREDGILLKEHTGGCTLFAHAEYVQQFIAEK